MKVKSAKRRQTPPSAGEAPPTSMHSHFCPVTERRHGDALRRILINKKTKTKKQVLFLFFFILCSAVSPSV